MITYTRSQKHSNWATGKSSSEDREKTKDMTLILTQISKFGIIHASDTNVTFSNFDPKTKTYKFAKVEELQKLFQIPYLNAALTVAGSYSVGNNRMQEWMNAFIQNQAQVF